MITILPATSCCLSQTKTWISNVMCRVCCVCNDLRSELLVRFVDIGGMF